MIWNFDITNPPDCESVPAVRLPTDYVPTHYGIFIHPDIPGKTFSAQVTIYFKCNHESSQLELHCHNTLVITSVLQNGSPLTFRTDGEKIVISGNNFDKSPITICYYGTLNHKMNGLYYNDDYSCCSKFEPSDARKMFPCFDEPWAKATFSITVRALASLTALSNMPAESVVNVDHDKITYFQTSPPMSTYLVAIAVGRYSHITGSTKRGLPIDIYLSAENAQYLQFPLKEAIKSVEYLEEYFDMEFDLPRLQILGAKRFMSGGMENYGLIIIMEQFFLAQPTDQINSEAGPASLSDYQLFQMACMPAMLDTVANLMSKTKLINLVDSMDESLNKLMAMMLSPQAMLILCSGIITHEIVHMWAGDIVSPKWWDSLWLNEGFATLLPSMMYRKYHPNYDFFFSQDDTNYQMALALDSLEGSRPIHSNLISEVDSFDQLSYNKAASILRMLQIQLGDDVFRDGYRLFLKKYKNSSADTNDFINTYKEFLSNLPENSPAKTFDIQNFFDVWIYAEGFPLIILEDNCLRQMSYTGNVDKVWPVPLQIIYGRNGVAHRMNVFLNTEETELNLDADWIIVNPGTISFCRVWHVGDCLQKAIMYGVKYLTVQERFNFWVDQQVLAARGMIDQDEISMLSI
ncbi:hypothetical protein TRFO_18726 [Tritrichomonas foetus]|uniref:Peptidase M1 membrane alanine aminopeptidase domain-containing protein n=1 Tax=Tritrichomonas foetus TaxID=1144522 RepID=A0A1J4KKS7_9EUKA|nr:hypothetical protein TRFO_18726 [Tritrichomonas foetus]|eukprot:OHT11746.1 hypothetical protein TRFO_18726 [Tritrichomonas foetus]